MAGRLEGKVVVITGTGGGQGREAALRFVHEGAKVVGCDLKAEGNEETVRLVDRAGGRMLGLHPLDLTVEGEVESLMKAAEAEFGGIDVLYNNAGAFRAGTLESQSYEDFEFSLRAEISTVFLAVKHVIPRMRTRGGGSIINVGSIAGQVGTSIAGNLPGAAVHCISKAGVIRLSEVAAIELSPLKIRVNTISPGVILTPQLAPFIGEKGDEGLAAEFIRESLSDRVGQSSDVVNAAVFLASDEAEWITGINLTVDGGFVASGGRGKPDSRVAEIMRQIKG
ncbi:SDR family NAD(P)-dependent oxidoreductase [Rhodococcus ruber]|uniref:SDR family NAD(P)-dependent oxidoreductase n=1 Tax=Rhodococcus ruber TaxID=1830 RepID=A0ABT4MEP2_9NOCA|nr:SDR family NAD(P)-dependent oxidoreductase [Rhodococcus ruber]MCZ4519457.1 SDR family NAD(P)-dependent oxidoreductase [Rhodococcus ruber]